MHKDEIITQFEDVITASEKAIVRHQQHMAFAKTIKNLDVYEIRVDHSDGGMPSLVKIRDFGSNALLCELLAYNGTVHVFKTMATDEHYVKWYSYEYLVSPSWTIRPVKKHDLPKYMNCKYLSPRYKRMLAGTEELT